MKTIMKTHRLLSFGASKLAIVQAKNASEVTRFAARLETARRQMAFDLNLTGKASLTIPTR